MLSCAASGVNADMMLLHGTFSFVLLLAVAVHGATVEINPAPKGFDLQKGLMFL